MWKRHGIDFNHMKLGKEKVLRKIFIEMCLNNTNTEPFTMKNSLQVLLYYRSFSFLCHLIDNYKKKDKETLQMCLHLSFNIIQNLRASYGNVRVRVGQTRKEVNDLLTTHLLQRQQLFLLTWYWQRRFLRRSCWIFTFSCRSFFGVQWWVCLEEPTL